MTTPPVIGANIDASDDDPDETPPSSPPTNPPLAGVSYSSCDLFGR